jgi:cytochrome c-type biogenesis protein CcmH/NrfG
MREALFGRFNADDIQLKAADAQARTLGPDYAAGILLAAVGRNPQDAALWTGLGLKIAEKDGNILSPAARFAFESAMALAPQHPGPHFFLGVAALRAGDVRTTIAAWQRAIEMTPKEASYRNQMVSELVRLIQFLEARKKAAEQQGTPSMSFDQPSGP